MELRRELVVDDMCLSFQSGRGAAVKEEVGKGNPQQHWSSQAECFRKGDGDIESLKSYSLDTVFIFSRDFFYFIVFIYLFFIAVQVQFSPFPPHHNPHPTPPISTSHPQSYPPLALSMGPLYMFLTTLPLFNTVFRLKSCPYPQKWANHFWKSLFQVMGTEMGCCCQDSVFISFWIFLSSFSHSLSCSLPFLSFLPPFINR